MKTFAGRRIRHSLIALAVAVVVVAAAAILQTALFRTEFVSGWLLAAMIASLAAYNLIKKLNVLPLGASASWLQFHIYCGLLTAVVFALHVGFRIPSGLFEGVLAAAYLLVFASGVAGLLLSRSLPRRLASRREEVLFERIPMFIRRLREEVEVLVFECVEKTETTAVPEFYLSHLKPFFEGPRNFWEHMVHSERTKRSLLRKIDEQNHYLNDAEREAMKKIAELAMRKDDLDYQHALQATLKYWLFAHVPLTWALLIFVLFHAILVHAFAGVS